MKSPLSDGPAYMNISSEEDAVRRAQSVGGHARLLFWAPFHIPSDKKGKKRERYTVTASAERGDELVKFGTETFLHGELNAEANV